MQSQPASPVVADKETGTAAAKKDPTRAMAAKENIRRVAFGKEGKVERERVQQRKVVGSEANIRMGGGV